MNSSICLALSLSILFFSCITRQMVYTTSGTKLTLRFDLNVDIILFFQFYLQQSILKVHYDNRHSKWSSGIPVRPPAENPVRRSSISALAYISLCLVYHNIRKSSHIWVDVDLEFINTQQCWR